MAIKAEYKLAKDVAITAYIKVSKIESYKTVTKIKNPFSKDEVISTPLTLAYTIEYYPEKDGTLLSSLDKTIGYNGGNVWTEAYENLKSGFDSYQDV